MGSGDRQRIRPDLIGDQTLVVGTSGVCAGAAVIDGRKKLGMLDIGAVEARLRALKVPDSYIEAHVTRLRNIQAERKGKVPKASKKFAAHRPYEFRPRLTAQDFAELRAQLYPLLRQGLSKQKVADALGVPISRVDKALKVGPQRVLIIKRRPKPPDPRLQVGFALVLVEGWAVSKAALHLGMDSRKLHAFLRRQQTATQ